MRVFRQMPCFHDLRAVRTSLTLRVIVAAVVAVAVGATGAAASEVQIFQTQSRPAFLAGTLEGVSVDRLGRLELADRVERITAVGEPFLFTGAAHPEGWVVGTGNAGKVLLVTRKGEVRELFATDEPEVFAVRVDADGAVLAGSSPRGKVYRLAPGAEEAEVLFDPGETYIWDLGRDAEGRLLVATGTEGKLYRVDATGEGEVVFDSDDTHLRSLLTRPGGEILLGTAGEGLILRLTPGRGSGGETYRVRTLFDADQPEVVALAEGPDGTAFVGLLASEASLVDLSGRPSSSSSSPSSDSDGEDGDEEPEDGEVTPAEVSVGRPGATGSRRAGFSGARSEVLQIFPSGRVETLWKLEDETLFDLLWTRGRLWAATGLEGQLYSWTEEEDLVLEKDVDERQLVALLPGDPGPAFATTNAAALYRVTAASERRGTYTSAALDAEQISRFGTFHWQGQVPAGTKLRFSFRTGMSSSPDRTWSDWTQPRGGQGLGLGDLPPGRYVQWRARLEAADGTSPVLFGAELSYLQQNLEPVIERLGVMDPGQVLVPANFNPGNQIWEPSHPNREGIFTTLEPDRSSGRLKTLWKKGYRTLRWEVEDPNDDQLVFRLEFRPDGAGEDGWLPMAEELADDHYSFDATVLPDGLYRFRLRASDARDNAPGDGRTAERITEPVVVDHHPPERARVRRRSGALEVEVTDALNPLREAEVSFDAGEWRPAVAADGLLDGRSETLTVELPDGEARLVLLRVRDAAHNVITFDLSEELP